MAFVGFHHRHRRPTTDKDRQFGIVDSVGSVGFQLADVRKKRNRRIAESPNRPRGVDFEESILARCPVLIGIGDRGWAWLVVR